MPVDVHTAEQAAIPGYRVGAALPGRTSEGTAYRAETEDGRPVELWVVPADDSRFAAQLRFLEGAKALAALHNEHLPPIVDSGESEGSLYLVTEPSEGPSLRELLERGEGLAPMRAIRLLGEAADALDAAHGAGVQHARLTADSVVVEDRTVERAVLRDFALGRRGSAQDDIRAFAGVMSECLTGSAPSGKVETGLSTELDAVLARGLSEDPRERPGSAAALVADAARAVMAAVPPPASEPSARAEPASATDVEPAAAQPIPARADRVPLRRRLTGATVPLLLAGLLVAAAAVAGWIVGKPESSAKTPKKVSSGDVEMAVPSGWRETLPVPRIAELPLHDAVSAAGPSGGRATAGIVSGTLPSRVAKRVANRPGSGDAVRLGDLQAYRWRGLEARGGGRMTLFAAGTDAGIVALACSGHARAIASCEKAAGSLGVPAGEPSELTELSAWSSRLDRVIRRLDRRRARDRAKLRAAGSPAAAARAPRRLAGDYSAARRSLAAHEAPAGAAPAHGRLERSMSRIAASYRRLASAARRQRAAAYRSASRAIFRRERALRRSLRSL